MRAIVFLLFVVLIFFIVRFVLNRVIEIRDKQRQQEFQKEKAQQAKKNNNPEEMVRCAECGVHLPQAEAYFDGKDTFCSEGHMQKYHAEHAHSKER
ncbi:PP0621 family protein [Thiomicrorhabdus sp. Milos-T2]|uniref:PP0621 family protein n=1 Tax=Thiomicrorhabdus sp. Milos-T2 TaxID=90814 RepID=UPI00049471A8|nr:PP0621 family protein [Thiomicrorhabdus sp. Milos-T2]